MVKVKLMEKRVKSHVGRVMVEKVMIQYKRLGMPWKSRENTQPIHPTILVGFGGDTGGGGRWELVKPERPERLAVMAGARGTSDENGDAEVETRADEADALRTLEEEGTDIPALAMMDPYSSGSFFSFSFWGYAWLGQEQQGQGVLDVVEWSPRH